MDQREIVEMAKKDLAFLQDNVLGVLIYGSWATGESHEKSDIDICIVAPSLMIKSPSGEKLLQKFVMIAMTSASSSYCRST